MKLYHQNDVELACQYLDSILKQTYVDGITIFSEERIRQEHSQINVGYNHPSELEWSKPISYQGPAVKWDIKIDELTSEPPETRQRKAVNSKISSIRLRYYLWITVSQDYLADYLKARYQQYLYS